MQLLVGLAGPKPVVLGSVCHSSETAGFAARCWEQLGGLHDITVRQKHAPAWWQCLLHASLIASASALQVVKSNVVCGTWFCVNLVLTQELSRTEHWASVLQTILTLSVHSASDGVTLAPCVPLRPCWLWQPWTRAALA